MLRTLVYIFVFAGLSLWWPVAPASAVEDADELSRSLGLSAEEGGTISRFPRPASKIAENVTIITADDIARVNAHTLADVLQTVAGVQLDEVTTPGTFSFISVLGTTTRHIQLLIDGVPQNFLSADNIADPGSIPVQMIDRVEIIKGAASAAWGSALGGVINVLTKSPNAEQTVGGIASASLGEQSTTDARAEITGTAGKLGYYLTGGNIHSQGLIPGNGTTLNHLFAKLTYDLPTGGNLAFGFDLRDNSPGQGTFPKYDYTGTGNIDNLSGRLTFTHPLADRLNLSVQASGGRRSISTQQGPISEPFLYRDGAAKEIFHNAKAEINWGDAEVNVVGGIDFQSVDIWQRELVTMDPAANFTASFKRTGAYLNGTYTIGRVSILPGVRFDHSNLVEDALSYTLGATVRLTDNTILRAYGARGYSLPMINNVEVLNGRRQLQNLWTVQAGVESAAIPYLWVKGTFFYNNIWNIQTFTGTLGDGGVVLAEQTRQGFDAELRTSPIYGVALSAGYTYSDSRDKKTGLELTGDTGPREGLKLGVNYDNSAIGSRASLLGNYVYYNLPGYDSKLSSIIWDLHLTQKLFPSRELSPEIFFSLHNIFNDDQYQFDLRPNTPRWVEGGMRYRF
ncbi:TonB-dependent receptor plug domain-containing protein [Geomonas sp. RF6]|uniref:TonB-dependent receptor plug domain-containing protein n=1 Tax=Geomonas sp. RF6 TaxID=2897342 RepID=UPI001E412059|nr:TonB-dependent receptor plug domain-containing protein [Geomonas sp. RF6]UFS70165.1 TonB-dependent receptor plug domain-containing protein [Geomonas sp. RF6]